MLAMLNVTSAAPLAPGPSTIVTGEYQPRDADARAAAILGALADDSLGIGTLVDVYA